jgi:hypothetical protein
MTNTTFTIRRASAADASAIARLAALDSASPPTGEMLLAEVGNEVWAAVEIDSGMAIADPFRPSGDLVELLHFRTTAMRRELAAPSRKPRLLPRAA